MSINQLIAGGIQLPRFESPMNMMAQLSQLESAREANELRKMQMAQMQRQQEQEMGLLAMSPTDLQADPTAALRFGKPGRETYSALLAGDRERRQAQLAEAQSIPKKIELMKFGLGAVNSPEQYASWREQTAKLLPGLAGVLPQEFTPETKRSMMLDADKMYKRVFESIDRGNVREVLALNEYGGGAPETVAVREVGARPQTPEQQRLATAQAARLEGEVAGTLPARARTPEQQVLDTARLESERTRRELDVLRAETERLRQQGALPGDKLAQARIENEQRRLEQAEARDRLAERRLNLAQEQAARAADPDFQFSISNARARGTATAKSDQEARDTLPNAIAAAQRTLDNINDMVGRPEVKDAQGRVVQAATKPHPGFENVVGFTYLPGLRFVPGTAAADFDARFKQVQGQAFLQAYEILRGGGHITEAEGTKGTAAINRMGLAQSEREFITAARELQEVVEAGIKRARGRLNAASGTESTGRGSAGGGGVAPAPAPAAAPLPNLINFNDLRPQ
jgi:hypothetical protein